MTPKTVEYRSGVLRILDQTKLPAETSVLQCTRHTQVAEAIRSLRVRGAPCIGVAAAFGVVLAARSLAQEESNPSLLRQRLDDPMKELRGARPTAVNLAWAVDRMRHVAEGSPAQDTARFLQDLEREAWDIQQEDETASFRMARYGADLVPDNANILTHCNTGALAASGLGTALGAIRQAHLDGKHVHVWVDETRPLLQGARLTAWECEQAAIPYTLLTDSMAGHFMARGEVDLVMVGADRIAANGDAANKIGTYGLAVLARAHELPFYVVAPTSTVDLGTASGRDITVEQRDSREVTTAGGRQIAPEGARAANPAFDVTPARLITAIVTDGGVLRAPFAPALARGAAGAGVSLGAPEAGLVASEGV